MSKFNEKYKNVTINGSHFPDKRIWSNNKITLGSHIKSRYIPAMNKVMVNEAYGFRLLLTIMAQKEGFYHKTRSYRYNNPGNIGNTDSGANKKLSSLEKGVELQRDYVLKIISGNHRAYPMGKRKLIKPYYSPEIARNSKLYGMSPWLPGYDFVFTGQLDQFVKIYSTGARAGNSYLSMIISFFNSKGLKINEKSKIEYIIKMESNGIR